MYRVYLDKNNPLFFIDKDICPLRKTICVPEEAILLRHLAVRPEIGEQTGT